MSNYILTPSTLEGIRSLAKAIKHQKTIPHHEALMQAAIQAGFQNYRHAQRELSKKSALKTGYQIFLTAYWRNKDTNTRGRETFTMIINQPLKELVTITQLRLSPRFGDCRFEGPDHVALRFSYESQSRARDRVCAMARAFQFINATGLKPSRGLRAYPKGKSALSIPGEDHASTWYDPLTQRYLLIDEPYYPASTALQKERDSWAVKHNFHVTLSSWPGMYNPQGGSRMYLISDAEKGVPLEGIIRALERLPAPINPSVWTGESAPFPPPFTSPGTLAQIEEKKQRKPNAVSRVSSKRSTVQYVNPISGAARRPDARMPIEDHKQVGQIIKTVLNDTHYRRGVYNKLNSVRCELDEWVQREYNRAELSDEVFFNLYYREDHSSFAKKLPNEIRARHSESLRMVKTTLSKHYPNCPPLRRLLSKIDAAVSSMDSWG